jgi:carbamoyltransferase
MSARVQCVHRDLNPGFWAVLEAFRALTGCPVLVNTSFNVRGEPIVCSPADAVRCFLCTDIDVLEIGPFLVFKSDNLQLAAESQKEVERVLD